MAKIILVDENDKPIGKIGKLEAHLGEGQRHRAFTAMLINDRGKILMAKRSPKKLLWPNFWDFSFSSHPRPRESLEQAAQRRAKEELGVAGVGFKDLFKYEYQVQWNQSLAENEINHILLGKYNGNLRPNREEISEWRWVSWEKLVFWAKKEPHIMAPWLIITIKEIEKRETLVRDFYAGPKS